MDQILPVGYIKWRICEYQVELQIASQQKFRGIGFYCSNVGAFKFGCHGSNEIRASSMAVNS